MSTKETSIRPFVKWVGGKTQLLDKIVSLMPKTYNKYFEPFAGGGALLFRIQPECFVINDMNEELICAYTCMKDDILYENLKLELIKHEQNHSEEYFYKIREMDKLNNFKNLPIYVRAGRMIYLNKSCFNGLYRVNSKGYFNTPFGKKDKVVCFDRSNFEKIHEYFKNSRSIIMNTDFEEVLKNACKNDFVYLDPPYDTWDTKNSFTSYNKNNFDKREQIRVSNVFKELSHRGVYVMLSNHNTEFIQELYKDFKITVVPAKRMINSKGTERGFVEEVIITNY